MDDGGQLGDMIRRLREERGWSQERLAELLAEASGRPTVTRSEVYRWETGKRSPKLWMPYLAKVFEVRQELLEAAKAGRAVPPAVSLSELLPPETDTLARVRTTAGRQVGRSNVSGLLDRVHGLRLADDYLAGGDLIGPAFRELRSAVKLYQEGSHTEDVGRGLLIGIGEMAQIVGWIASDAGQRTKAEEAYRLGISAAKEAEDGTLLGNLIGSLSYHYANNRRPADAVILAQAALDAEKGSAPPRARALTFDRAAWAHTMTGQAQEAMRALGEAGEALTQHTTGTEDPNYLYWVDAGELQVMEARVYTELHRPLRAVPLLTDVLARYDATHAREMSLYLSWLAIAYADANEPEAAAETAERMISLSSELASDRTATRTRAVLERLDPLRCTPEVGQLLADHRPLPGITSTVSEESP
jgi:transcriptional regulator with XRE-family HTH domain